MTAVANDNLCPTRPNAFVRFVRNLIQKRRDARSMRAMMEMNDHILRDIGVTRFDIRYALDVGRGESSGARLARVVEENRLAQLCRDRAACAIRPRSADEKVRLAA